MFEKEVFLWYPIYSRRVSYEEDYDTKYRWNY